MPKAFLATLAAALLLAACSGPLPRARIPSSGVTAVSGGGERELGNQPAGLTRNNQ